MARPSADEMRGLVKQGKALPAPGQSRPGRFNIETRDDLDNAIKAIGRVPGGEAARAVVRRFVIKRARAMGMLDMIPDTWNADGSLKA